MQKEYPKVIVGSGKDQSLRRFHPWVFSGAIKKIKNADGKGEVTPEEEKMLLFYLQFLRHKAKHKPAKLPPLP